jgi:hypothetical protein
LEGWNHFAILLNAENVARLFSNDEKIKKIKFGIHFGGTERFKIKYFTIKNMN